MNAFIMACAALVVLSGLFYLVPRKKTAVHKDDLKEANLEWYRLRQAELGEGGDEELQRDIQLRLLEDDAQAAAAGAVASNQSFPRWALFPVITLAAVALYYQLGAAPDVVISKQLKALAENSPPEQIQLLSQAIEARSVQRPDNLHYRALLGRFYMGRQDYARAAQLYGDLAKAGPDDSVSLALAAQAEYLANDRVLSEQAQMYAEQALAINPHERTALGLLGMASFEKNQFRAAIEYWQRLLAMEQPGSDSAQMISSVIERANAGLAAENGQLASTGQSAASAAHGSSAVETSATANPGAVSPGVTVRVRIPEGANIASGDTVFVLARGANSSSRMPVAVQRLQASQLPMTIRLDDSKSMAGQKLSATESIVVVVQVSPNGTPGEASASWLGQAGPLAPSLDTEPLDIELYRRES